MAMTDAERLAERALASIAALEYAAPGLG